MKKTLIIALLATLSAGSLLAVEPPSFDKVAFTTSIVNAGGNQTAILAIIDAAVRANPSQTAEIVKAAIETLDPDDDLIALIVETAIRAAPAQAAAIVRAAIEASDADADLVAIIVRAAISADPTQALIIAKAAFLAKPDAVAAIRAVLKEVTPGVVADFDKAVEEINLINVGINQINQLADQLQTTVQATGNDTPP